MNQLFWYADHAESILAIPFILTPLITGTIGYFATALGLRRKQL